MENIEIKNFGGINYANITLNQINIFIGKQASGKSVTTKLIFYFKGFIRSLFEELRDDEGKTKSDIETGFIKKFEEYFPSETWGDKAFEIAYTLNDNFIKISLQEKKKIKLEYSKNILKQFNAAKKIINADIAKFVPKDTFEVYRPNYSVMEKYLSLIQKEIGKESSYHQIFIPAGRSFFANLQSSIFSFLSNNKAIDPFLVEFGSFYETIKSFSSREINANDKLEANADKIIKEILGGKYLRDKKKDFLIHEDKRKINVSFASSGQQETLPLLLILKAFLTIRFVGSGSAIFIEEPEAHLFPEAQRKIVDLLGLVFNNSKSELQIFITTHSPYLLTAFNNLLQAGKIFSEANTAVNKELAKIVPFEHLFHPGILNAFAMTKGSVVSIIDDETNLIQSSYLDNISEDIAIQFDNLLELL